MKFLLIDRIESVEPGKRIVTSKNLSLAEEYLQDHFPSFPVLPGVLMLEALEQSAAWLVRIEQNFANSLIILKIARNVRYNYFLRPGNTLRCEVEMISIDDKTAKFKGQGFVGDRLAFSARLELTWTNITKQGQFGKDTDRRILEQVREHFALLGGPELIKASRK